MRMKLLRRDHIEGVGVFGILFFPATLVEPPRLDLVARRL
jgi:hypothetical protein